MTTPEGRAELIGMLEMNAQRSITMGNNMRKYGYSEEGFIKLREDMGRNATRGLYFDANGQLTDEGNRLNAMDPTYAQPTQSGFRGIVGPNGERGRMSPDGTTEVFNEQTGQWEPL
jgi:hypothetical protein